MYIRKKKNKSGSYSVAIFIGERVEGKKHPISKMIKSFGASKDEMELQALWEQAEQYKQQLLLVAPVKPKSLKINGDIDINSCSSYNVGFIDVYGSLFDATFNKLGLTDNVINRLKELIVMRIANPCSKRKTSIIAHEYGIEFNLDNIYKLMDKLNSQVIAEIKRIIYNNTMALLATNKQTVNILFYDLTTIYFETNSQDELRDFGFSKDGKHQHVQIVLATIVTTDGLLIDYEEFVGNTYEGHTLIPVLNKLRQAYNINQVVLVADAALMNKINLQELDGQGIKYIIAARMKNSTKTIKEQVLNKDGYTIINESTSYTTGEIDTIQSKIIPHGDGNYLIAYYSSKRAYKDYHDRISDLEKIQKHLSSSAKSKLATRLRKSYVKVSKGSTVTIDYDRFNQEAQFDGFFGLVTNISNPVAQDILNSYRGLWQIEQTFRIAKSSLQIRPVFHYTPRRIKAHFIICYMALAIMRHLEYILKNNKIALSLEQINFLLSQMNKVRIINSDNELFEILENPPPEIIPIYQILNIKLHKKFQFIKKM